MQGFYSLDVLSLFDLSLCSVSNEDWLATPFDDDVLAFWNCAEIDFNFSHSQNIGGCGHVNEEICEKAVLANCALSYRAPNP